MGRAPPQPMPQPMPQMRAPPQPMPQPMPQMRAPPMPMRAVSAPPMRPPPQMPMPMPQMRAAPKPMPMMSPPPMRQAPAPMPVRAMSPPPMPVLQGPPMPVRAMSPPLIRRAPSPPMPMRAMSPPPMPVRAMSPPPMPVLQGPPMPMRAMSPPLIHRVQSPPIFREVPVQGPEQHVQLETTYDTSYARHDGPGRIVHEPTRIVNAEQYMPGPMVGHLPGVQASLTPVAMSAMAHGHHAPMPMRAGSPGMHPMHAEALHEAHMRGVAMGEVPMLFNAVSNLTHSELNQRARDLTDMGPKERAEAFKRMSSPERAGVAEAVQNILNPAR